MEKCKAPHISWYLYMILHVKTIVSFFDVPKNNAMIQSFESVGIRKKTPDFPWPPPNPLKKVTNHYPYGPPFGKNTMVIYSYPFSIHMYGNFM
jgi:hypothetical protein